MKMKHAKKSKDFPLENQYLIGAIISMLIGFMLGTIIAILIS